MKSPADAVAHAKALVGKDAPGGPGHCEQFVRECLGLPAYAPSAKVAAGKVPAKERHRDGFPHAVPAGAQVFYDMSQYGHVTLSLGDGKCATNDYAVRGKICEAPVDLPNWHGAQHFQFWTTWSP